MTLRASFFSLLSVAALASCSNDKADPTPNGLVGYWQLDKLECYCPANTPTPNEAIEFDAAGNVTAYVNGQVRQVGTYQLGTGSNGCVTNADLVTFSWFDLTPSASYSIDNGVLILDQGLCRDAPRKTYTYVPRRGE